MFVVHYARFAKAGEIRAESVRISFEILETPPARLRARVSGLAHDLTDTNARQMAPLLGFTGDASAVAPLVQRLYSFDRGAQVAAADALLYLNPERVREGLWNYIGTRGPRETLVYLLSLLSGLENPEAGRLLARWLGARNADARAAAVHGVAISNRSKDPELFEPLKLRLGDPIPAVRRNAVMAVSAYANEAAFEALKPAVQDANPDVRAQASSAVGWIAAAAAPGSSLRRDAVAVLKSIVQLGCADEKRPAIYYLEKIRQK
jgi:HEAT repeat protein